MLVDLVKRLEEQEVVLTYDDAVVDWVVREGTDADFGARPLKRFIQRNVETVVAKEIIKGEIRPGEVLALSMVDGKLDVHKG